MVVRSYMTKSVTWACTAKGCEDLYDRALDLGLQSKLLSGVACQSPNLGLHSIAASTHCHKYHLSALLMCDQVKTLMPIMPHTETILSVQQVVHQLHRCMCPHKADADTPLCSVEHGVK